MNRVKINDLNYCQAETTELDNVLGGEGHFFADDGFFEDDSFEKDTTFSTNSSPTVTLTKSTDSTSVEEKVVSKDGLFAKAKVERGRNFRRASSRAVAN